MEGKNVLPHVKQAVAAYAYKVSLFQTFLLFYSYLPLTMAYSNLLQNRNPLSGYQVTETL